MATTVQMLAVELTALVLTILIGLLRIFVGYRKRWSPSRIEPFGVATFVLGCVCAGAAFAHWSIQGMRMLRWENDGVTAEEIRRRTLGEGDLKLIFIFNPIMITAHWSAKASFLAAYAPTFDQYSRGMRTVFFGTAMYTAMTYLICVSAFLFYCFPVERNWQMSRPDFCATILQSVPLNLAMSFNITTDLLLLCIPLILLRRVRMASRSEIYGVMLIVGLGLISLGVMIFRVVNTETEGFTRGVPLTLGKRNSYIVQEAITAVTLLYAFCLPHLRVLVRQLRRSSNLKGGLGHQLSVSVRPRKASVKFGVVSKPMPVHSPTSPFGRDRQPLLLP